MTTTYYGYEIYFDETDQKYKFALGGWVYAFYELEKAKQCIKLWK